MKTKLIFLLFLGTLLAQGSLDRLSDHSGADRHSTAPAVTTAPKDPKPIPPKVTEITKPSPAPNRQTRPTQTTKPTPPKATIQGQRHTPPRQPTHTQTDKQPDETPLLQMLIDQWLLPTAALVLVLLFGYAGRHGVGEKMGLISPQLHPPRGMSLLQSSLLHDKSVSQKDLAAAIVELAHLGYLEIHNLGGDQASYVTRINKRAFGLTEDQIYLLDELLFKRSDTYVFTIASNPKYEQLTQKVSQLFTSLYHWSEAAAFFRRNPSTVREKFARNGLIATTILTALSVYQSCHYYGSTAAVMLLMASIFLMLGLLIIASSLRARQYIGLAFGIVWLGAVTAIFYDILSDVRLAYTPVLVFPPLAATLAYFYKQLGQLEYKGLSIHRHMLGYAEYLEKPDRAQIQIQLRQKPDYLDQTIAYAIMLGVEKEWGRLYSDLNIRQPAWYHGNIAQIWNFALNVAMHLNAKGRRRKE